MRWFDKAGTIALSAMLSASVLVGCGNKSFSMPYSEMQQNDNYYISNEIGQYELDFFAKDLAATNKDILEGTAFDPTGLKAVALYDITDKKVLYSYKACERLYPASLTKVMTSLVVLNYCYYGGKSLDETIKLGDITIKESGAQTIGLSMGDTITVRDLFNLSLIYSANDASLALAQYIAGSEEAFVELMNQTAISLGCTGTHFCNSNGLPNDDHYTTAYDMYMIFYAASQFPEFRESIMQAEYSANIITASGEQKTKTVISTNQFTNGKYAFAGNIVALGGKTGSTNAAGKCLMEYLEDTAGKKYVCIILGAVDEDTLYKNMRFLCDDLIK